MNSHSKSLIVLTAGEPSSINSLILFKAYLKLKESLDFAFFTINNYDLLEELNLYYKTNITLQKITSPLEAIKVFPKALPVLDIPLQSKVNLGELNKDNSPFVKTSIDKTVDLALEKKVNAVVTLPICKYIMQGGDFNFIGHTEYLAFKSKINLPLMMMASPFDRLKVVLVSTHLSLQNAITTLSQEKIITVAQTLNHNLKKLFNIKSPKIAVLGLNPHSGEEGLMGNEEINIINPAIKKLQDLDINVVGAVPPDTAFTPNNRNHFDAYVAMYHDQGLIPFKTLLFDKGVNTTLGLPFIRTSPDHGTAIDIAKDNTANEESLVSSILLANQMHRASLKNE